MLYGFYKVGYLLTYRANTRGPSGPKKIERFFTYVGDDAIIVNMV